MGCQNSSSKVGKQLRYTITRNVFKERFSRQDRNYQAHFDAGWTQVFYRKWSENYLRKFISDSKLSWYI